MKIMLDVKSATDKPKKTGYYLAFCSVVEGGEELLCSASNHYFNAKTGRWNDVDGSGDYTIDSVRFWAELPEIGGVTW